MIALDVYSTWLLTPLFLSWCYTELGQGIQHVAARDSLCANPQNLVHPCAIAVESLAFASARSGYKQVSRERLHMTYIRISYFTQTDMIIYI